MEKNKERHSYRYIKGTDFALIILLIGVSIFVAYFYNLNGSSVARLEKYGNSGLKPASTELGFDFKFFNDKLYSLISGHSKKIVVIDHGKEIYLNAFDIMDYISNIPSGKIRTVGDIIQSLNIPLTRRQSEEINLCKKIDEFKDGDKIVINPDIYQHGIASWYGPGFQGRFTASGEIYNIYDSTAAHRTLPLGTMIRVFNTYNDKSTVVRINDRGPYVEGRIIDLNLKSKQELEMEDLAVVYFEILDQGVVYKNCK